jgi:CRISPR/Cas system-associated exonuclease Cas4 (RecB family)
MNDARPHWSYSAISQYLRCPLQFYFERVLKLPRTTIGGGLVLGSAVRAALASHHLNLKAGRRVKVEALHAALLECWTNREAEENIAYKEGENRNNLIAQGIALVELYFQEPPPEKIVAVERRTLVPLQNSAGNYLETPLTAIIDLVTQEPDGLKVNEFKTSGRSYGEFEVATSLQATCYVNAVWETFGEWASVEFAVLVKTKTPKIQRIATARTEEDLGRLGDLVENVERAVSAGVFHPVETPMNCSTCSFRRQCREWRPERSREKSEPEVVQLNGAAIC